MSKFTDEMATDPPRLVVLFRTRETDGVEEFQWGVIHQMPILAVVGYIHRVQRELLDGSWTMDCPYKAVAIIWDASAKKFRHFCHADTPRESMAGQLECIKSALVASRVGQIAAAQRVQSPKILGPDGNPFPM